MAVVELAVLSVIVELAKLVSRTDVSAVVIGVSPRATSPTPMKWVTRAPFGVFCHREHDVVRIWARARASPIPPMVYRPRQCRIVLRRHAWGEGDLLGPSCARLERLRRTHDPPATPDGPRRFATDGAIGCERSKTVEAETWRDHVSGGFALNA